MHIIEVAGGSPLEAHFSKCVFDMRGIKCLHGEDDDYRLCYRGLNFVIKL